MVQNQFEKYKDIEAKLLVGDDEKADERFCFVIPTYKRPHLLKRALCSIFNQKSEIKFNIVVVDNDNTENSETENYIRELGKEKDNLFYYKNASNIGLFGNWNRCYQLARGEYCCILMDDDEVTENYLERINNILENSTIDCLRVGSEILDEHNNKVCETSQLEKKYLNRYGHLEYINWRYFLYRGALPPSGMCIKKSVMLSTGGYNEAYWPGSDFEMDMRLVAQSKVALLWERLCITHTEESTSMTEKAIKKSVPQGLLLYKRAYNDIFHKKGRYDWIAEVRTWIAIEKTGYKVEELEPMCLNKKYNSFFYKTLYKIMYRIHRIKQTYL